MGFDHYLVDSAEASDEGRVRATRAYVDINGDFTEFYSGEARSLRVISCYKSGEYKITVKVEKYIENIDGTVTAIAPKLVRGIRNHLISGEYDSASIGTCKALGFKNYLKDSMFAKKATGYKTYLSDKGEYVKDAFTVKTYITEISCYGDSRVVVVVDDSGKEYLRQQD